MGNEYRGAFVDPIYLSRDLSTIDKELDGVSWSKSVSLRSDFAVSEQAMLGGSMSEESLCHAFEAGLGAAGVPPDKHFGEVEQFVFHDAAKAFSHVLASDSADDCGLLIRPGLSQQLTGDCDLESCLAGPGMEAGGRAATRAGHSLGDPKAECVSCVADSG